MSQLRSSFPRPPRLTPIAAALASILLTTSAYGAEKTLAEQNAELKSEVAQLKQAIAELKGTAPAAAPASPMQAAAPAAAQPEEQETLGEITVRARNRLERLKDVPVSVSVVSGTELDRLQARDLGSITQRAANVSWNQGNARTSALSIRGLGKQAQTDAQDPSVGITVDGVSYAYNPLSSFDFYDVDAVEVLRGPQGTLYGKNASVGAISVNTRRPSFTPDASYSVALGQNHRVIANAAGGGAVIDNLLAWRGAFSVDKGQGDYPNEYNRDFTYKNKDNVSGRVQFLLTPYAGFDALLKVEVTPRHEEYYNGWTFFRPTPSTYANGAVNPLTTDASTRLARRWFTQQSDYSYQNNYLGNAINQDNQRPLVTGTDGASAILNWKLGSHTLTSITGYKTFYFQARNDEGTPFDISKNGGGYVSDHKQSSEELRLSSGLGGFVDYQAGLYFLKSQNNYSSRTGFGSDAGAWFASPAQYTRLDADGNGRYLLQNSLSRLEHNTPQHIVNRSSAIYGQANWHLSDPFTVTTGLRLTSERRSNWSSKTIVTQGLGAELNPVSVNGVALGGFASDANGNLGTNNATQLALANAVALKYFGVANYSALSAAQKRQVSDAKAIRQTNLGVLWNPVQAEAFREVQPTALFSPSYKFNEDVTGYVSLQYGEKAGISQIVNGASSLTAPEKSAAYELGFKSTLLDKKLTLNADLFLTNVGNYQQAVQVYDDYTTRLNNNGQLSYISATGSVAKVRAYGLEFDGVYSGIRDISLRFSGAYNNAKYRDFKNSSNPVEIQSSVPYRDVSGENLPGAGRLSFNIGAEYKRALAGSNKVFHTSFNTAYTGKYNSDVALSSYAWVPSYSVTDFAIGVGTADQKFDVNLLIKNAFDNRTSQVVTWNSTVPAVPRWIGLVFSAKL
ncbi:MAG: TonB-dependent receptor [Pseudomonadota bacterium]